MPTRDQLFPSKYLKGYDLKGRNVTVTIDRVESTRIRGDKVNLIHFEGKEKALVMNVTIYGQIANALGEENTDNWNGRDIILYPTETEYQGEMVSVVRVKPSRSGQPEPPRRAETEAPRPAPPAAKPDDDDDIPF
jgi:hypothetical protein